MRSTTRWRSRFNGMASMSLTAEGLISSLYLATLPQVFQDFLKRQVGFVGPGLEGGQILHILGQSELYRPINQLGNRLVRLRGLEPQGPVQVGIEVKLRLFWVRFSCRHYNPLTLKRQDGFLAPSLPPHPPIYKPFSTRSQVALGNETEEGSMLLPHRRDACATTCPL